ncbi:hypothetical protein EMPG_14030, partial [Blastomyces silverae]
CTPKIQRCHRASSIGSGYLFKESGTYGIEKVEMSYPIYVGVLNVVWLLAVHSGIRCCFF